MFRKEVWIEILTAHFQDSGICYRPDIGMMYECGGEDGFNKVPKIVFTSLPCCNNKPG